jgi:dTDP-4-amino-4,6-dideoxygalactose transaminase
MSDLAAALMRVQLQRVPDAIARRTEIRDQYHVARPDLVLPLEGTRSLAVCQFPTREARDAARAAFTEAAIETTVHYPYVPRTAPLAERWAATELTLPLHHRMKKYQVDRVVEVLQRLP